MDMNIGPELKPGRRQKWLSIDLLHEAPSAEFCVFSGKNGAQLEHPKGGPLTWVQCPISDAVGVIRHNGKWHWQVKGNA